MPLLHSDYGLKIFKKKKRKITQEKIILFCAARSAQEDKSTRLHIPLYLCANLV